MSPSRVVDLSTHFWARVDTSAGPEACWYWMLSTNAYGYGQLVMQQVHWIAHLFAYQDQIGLIPEGYEIDHGHKKIQDGFNEAKGVARVV